MAPRTACALAFAAMLLAVRSAPAAVEITDTERRWLDGATPPLAWALKQGMPIDLVVLQEPRPGASPLSMAYEEGRCELVLSMRDNPTAEATLAEIPPALLQSVLEAMTAHEIGHCQHHRSGTFESLPQGFVDKPDETEARQPTAELQAEAREMRARRREESYADLAALAWTRANNPGQYAQVLAWFDKTRGEEAPHTSHDTGHWLALAHGADAFADKGMAFERVDALWQQGLLDD